MGAFLDKPKTEKTTVSGEGNGIKYGISAMQGWRMEMEDAHVNKLAIRFKNSGFFGVFDGHAGPKVAQHCAENLLASIIKYADKLANDTDPPKFEVADTEAEHFDEMIKKAMQDGFIRLDETMKTLEPWVDAKDRSGTTSVVSLITPGKIVFGNCGDSRGLLCRSGEVFFATEDHKPFNAGERSRIEKAGGTVMMQRVNGALAVSRALGDFDFKRSADLPPIDQLISPEPEVTIVSRDSENDHFLLLACDGIFDVMTNEEVVDYVSHQLSLTHNLPEICSSLLDKCLNKNSRDNMSVILVIFPGAPAVSETAIQEEEAINRKCDKLIDAALKTIVEEAVDPLDLEDCEVLSKLQKLEGFPSYFDVNTRRDRIVGILEEARTKKFGANAKDFLGPTDAGDANSPFFDDHRIQTSPLATQSSESDTVNKEDTSSTPNIM